MSDLNSRLREQFIMARAKEEQKLKAYSDAIQEVDKEAVFGDLEIPSSLELKDLCPELYVDKPNEEIYLEQYNKAVELINKINKCIVEYNKEGLKCLQEFQQKLS